MKTIGNYGTSSKEEREFDDTFKKYIDRYIKNGVSKSNIHVIKDANLQMKLFRKAGNWQQICKKTS